ncbi:MAG TPA: aerial mycelium formation protein [Actinomycetota bacterium]
MSEEPFAGGKRRIDLILAAGFADGIESMDLDELRRRRDLCRGEREYLSLLRRLLQGRRDLLRDERERRAGGGQPGSIVERVSAVLADAPRGPSRGEAVMISVPEEEIALARRSVERLLADAGLSDLEHIEDAALESAIALLDEEERKVSNTRNSVMSIHDQLQDVIKERWRTKLRGTAS